LQLNDVSFADDPISADAPSLIATATTAAEICVDVFALHATQLNFKPGKSEALVHWVGT
jgi:hypothetical protein